MTGNTCLLLITKGRNLSSRKLSSEVSHHEAMTLRCALLHTELIAAASRNQSASLSCTIRKESIHRKRKSSLHTTTTAPLKVHGSAEKVTACRCYVIIVVVVVRTCALR